MKILMTGTSGFIGAPLASTLSKGGHSVHSLSFTRFMKGSDDASVPRVDVLIHLGARVHLTSDRVGDPLSEYRRVNTSGTLELARQAVRAGVKRFVFVSSIKVNGEVTQSGRPFAANDMPAPTDPYGVSKMEAEQGLLALSREAGIEVVIIRPPLVYGPGVKANFAAMIRWLQRGVPLPFGAIYNRRSLVALDNLIDLTITCVTHPAATGRIFMVSDGEDVSTTELLLRMSRALGCVPRLIPVPARWIEIGARIIGKKNLAQRLCDSLQVDIEETRCVLGWRPPFTLDEGLKKVAGDR